MTPEDAHIKDTNGRSCSYSKNKAATVHLKTLESFLCIRISTLFSPYGCVMFIALQCFCFTKKNQLIIVMRSGVRKHVSEKTCQMIAKFVDVNETIILIDNKISCKCKIW